MKKNILVVEGDCFTLKILTTLLEKYGFQVIGVASGNDALERLKKHDITAIILELNLPDINGLEILKFIRKHPFYKLIAVIIVTANDDELETILCLEMGADDYITKPFRQRELVARLNTILRRTQYRPANGFNSLLVFDDVEVNMEKRLVKKDGKPVDLSFKEFEILILLASNPGKVVPREEILNKIGGLEYNPETRTIDMHISSIRRKLGDTGKVKKYIDTVNGVGYRFRESSAEDPH